MWTGKSQSYGRKQSGRESNRLERERERVGERRNGGRRARESFAKAKSVPRGKGEGRRGACLTYIHSLTLHRVVTCR